jgi:hypothetical protein
MATEVYTVNLTRRAILSHSRGVLVAPLVQFTLSLGWNWSEDIITTWDPLGTGNFILRLVDEDTQTILPEFSEFTRWDYDDQKGFDRHFTDFCNRLSFLRIPKNSS